MDAENNGNELREPEQVRGMDAYTRPTLKFSVITVANLIVLVFDMHYLI